MDKGDWLLKLLGAVLGAEAVGGIGAIATARSVKTWYPELKKPSFTPPGWVFGPVWTLLYALMGTAAYLASRREEADQGMVRLAQTFYGAQLTLNLLWSLIFFGRRSVFGALVEIVFLWLAIVLTIAAFWRISRPAALLLVPYLAWTSFAAVLNYSIWRLNKERERV